MADLKRVAAPSAQPQLNVQAPVEPVLAELAATLDSQGHGLVDAVAFGLYHAPRNGWFRTDRARRPLRQWVEALSRAFRGGAQAEALAATGRLVRSAEVGGASLLECLLFVERFTGALLALAQRSPGLQASAESDARRALELVQHAVVSGR